VTIAHTPGVHIRNGTTEFKGAPPNDRPQKIALIPKVSARKQSTLFRSCTSITRA
jgi:hypothetical protein